MMRITSLIENKAATGFLTSSQEVASWMIRPYSPAPNDLSESSRQKKLSPSIA
jgi:hypothetical protein